MAARRPNPKRKPGSRKMNVGTREEYVSRLMWSIDDAKAALHNAVDMSDWTGVMKYAKQIQGFEGKLFKATAMHNRWDKQVRGEWSPWAKSAGAKFGRGRLP